MSVVHYCAQKISFSCGNIAQMDDIPNVFPAPICTEAVSAMAIYCFTDVLLFNFQ